MSAEEDGLAKRSIGRGFSWSCRSVDWCWLHGEVGGGIAVWDFVLLFQEWSGWLGCLVWDGSFRCPSCIVCGIFMPDLIIRDVAVPICPH